MTRNYTEGFCTNCNRYYSHLRTNTLMCAECQATSLDVPDSDSPCRLDDGSWEVNPANPLTRVWVAA